MLIIAINFENSCSCSCVVPDVDKPYRIKAMKKLIMDAQKINSSFIEELLVVKGDNVVLHWSAGV